MSEFPTQRQENFARVINKATGVPLPGMKTKQAYLQYISGYINTFKPKGQKWKGIDDCNEVGIALEQESRTGYWIEYDEEYYVIDRLKPIIHSIRECSECHTKIANFSGELKRCPNCKVKMGKVVNNDKRGNEKTL